MIQRCGQPRRVHPGRQPVLHGRSSRARARRIEYLRGRQVGRDNPTELKAQKLARSLTRGVIDRDLKPDTEERRQIAAILKQPPNRPLTVEQKGLLWRFRFSLTTERSALTRFLKSVDWSDAQEAKQVRACPPFPLAPSMLRPPTTVCMLRWPRRPS